MNYREEPEYLNPNQLMDKLNLSRSAVYGLLREEIPHYKIGGVIRIKKDDYENFMLGKRVPQSWWVSDDSDDQDEDEEEKNKNWWKVDEAGDDLK